MNKTQSLKSQLQSAVLLDCPFCGNKAQIAQKGTIDKPMIICCSKCTCNLESGDIYGLTTNLDWNRRVKT